MGTVSPLRPITSLGHVNTHLSARVNKNKTAEERERERERGMRDGDGSVDIDLDLSRSPRTVCYVISRGKTFAESAVHELLRVRDRHDTITPTPLTIGHECGSTYDVCLHQATLHRYCD